ncbi:MAG: class A beta-lactamase, subclass A2 [bacterium]
MKHRIFSLIFLALLTVQSIGAQTDALKQRIIEITKPYNATVGVGVKMFDNGDALIINPDSLFVMQSVYKFHLAMAVLDQVDKGNLKLDQLIHIDKKDLKQTYSPLREKYPDGNVDIPLSEIIGYTVSFSDNTGCDLLFRLIGGPAKVQEYMNGLGVGNISIKSTEEEMSQSREVQFTNTTSPGAALELLDIFRNAKALSPESNIFLWKVMTETSTGPNRIKGLLPEGTPVAHKTGSSGVDDFGITVATNDIGIITLPDGKQYALALFVQNSLESSAVNEKIIAEISKAVWDHYNK